MKNVGSDHVSTTPLLASRNVSTSAWSRTSSVTAGAILMLPQTEYSGPVPAKRPAEPTVMLDTTMSGGPSPAPEGADGESPPQPTAKIAAATARPKRMRRATTSRIDYNESGCSTFSGALAIAVQRMIVVRNRVEMITRAGPG